MLSLMEDKNTMSNTTNNPYDSIVACGHEQCNCFSPANDNAQAPGCYVCMRDECNCYYDAEQEPNSECSVCHKGEQCTCFDHDGEEDCRNLSPSGEIACTSCNSRIFPASVCTEEECGNIPSPCDECGKDYQHCNCGMQEMLDRWDDSI